MTSPSPSTSASEAAAPRSLVLSLWALSVFLTVFRADDVRDWLGPRADGLVAIADRLGLRALREHSDDLRASLYGVHALPPAPPPAASEALHASTHARAEPSAQVPAHDIAPRPRSVLLIGASSMQFAIGQALEAQLAAYEGLSLRRVAKVSTGLSRPDEFNWPARLEELLAEHQPDLVIVNFGGNDAQNIPLPQRKRAEFYTPAWDAEYGARVADFVTRIRARGAQAVMIGMPIMRSPDFSKKMLRLNKVTETATLAAGGIYLDQWDLAATPSGAYREFVDEGRRARPMRMEDGIHYSVAGGRYVVARLLRRLERKVRLVPKDPKLAVVERHTFHSPALGTQASYLAWLPRLQSGERVPLLVLLHDAESSPDELSERLHPQLAAAAQAGRIAIVAPSGDAGWWLDSPERKNSRYASLVRQDLLADAQAHLPVSEARGITGISMGGHGALTLAFEHPELFRSASSISGVLDLTLAGDRPALVALLGPLDAQRERWQAHSAVQLFERAPARLALRVSCGDKDRWIGASRALHARAEARQFAHAYDEAPGGHEWSYWQSLIPQHVAWHAQLLAADHSD